MTIMSVLGLVSVESRPNNGIRDWYEEQRLEDRC